MAKEDVEMQDEPKPTSSPEDWIRVNSNDGYTFLVRRKVANVSGTIRNALDSAGGNFVEANTMTYNAVEQRGIIVQKMLEYMTFKAHYAEVGPKEEVPVQEMMERIPPEIVLELLLAADYQEM